MEYVTTSITVHTTLGGRKIKDSEVEVEGGSVVSFFNSCH